MNEVEIPVEILLSSTLLKSNQANTIQQIKLGTFSFLISNKLSMKLVRDDKPGHTKPGNDKPSLDNKPELVNKNEKVLNNNQRRKKNYTKQDFGQNIKYFVDSVAVFSSFATGSEFRHAPKTFDPGKATKTNSLNYVNKFKQIFVRELSCQFFKEI